METKEQTIQLVKEWVQFDNDIRKLQKEIATRKKEKTKISSVLMEVMKKTNTGCYELKNGVLLYETKSVKKPMTKKVLLNVLNKYYKGDYMKATELNDFILSNREEVTQERLVHKIDNPNDD
jgi:hypothetical protein